MSKDIVFGKWVKLIEALPTDTGWYLVRDKDTEKQYAMYFKENKRSYSDTQWYLTAKTGHCWKGLMPEKWLQLT